jgi:hypothetical protein
MRQAHIRFHMFHGAAASSGVGWLLSGQHAAKAGNFNELAGIVIPVALTGTPRRSTLAGDAHKRGTF